MDLDTIFKDPTDMTNLELADMLEDAAIILEENNEDNEASFVQEAIARLRKLG